MRTYISFTHFTHLSSQPPDLHHPISIAQWKIPFLTNCLQPICIPFFSSPSSNFFLFTSTPTSVAMDFAHTQTYLYPMFLSWAPLIGPANNSYPVRPLQNFQPLHFNYNPICQNGPPNFDPINPIFSQHSNNV